MGFINLFKREKIYKFVVLKKYECMSNSIMITDYTNEHIEKKIKKRSNK